MRLFVLSVLLLMAVQDFRRRAIIWYAFPLLGAGLLLLKGGISLADTGMNLGFVGLNFALLTLVFSWKAGGMVNLFKRHIGLGDLLMLVCLGLYFPALNFFAFYLGSLLLISLGAGVCLLWRRAEGFTIPLAGLQGLLLTGLLVWCWSRGTELNAWMNMEGLLS